MLTGCEGREVWVCVACDRAREEVWEGCEAACQGEGVWV